MKVKRRESNPGHLWCLSRQCSATELQQPDPVWVGGCPGFGLPAAADLFTFLYFHLSMRFIVVSHLLNLLLGALYEAAKLDFELARR